jgi:uncharacterized protein
MNAAFMEISLAGEVFYLLPQKALFRPSGRQLILSDVHLGKASHFRKKGIALPAASHLSDMDRLEYLVQIWNPATILILGDLFHSEYNREWLWFRSLVLSHPDRQFILVEGNHDILPEKNYDLPNLFRASEVEETQIIFSHSPLQESGKLNICGHVHPGIRLTGKARQSLTFPCFCLSEGKFILPAFGRLTGLALLEWKETAEYYLVTDDTVVRL